MKAQKGIYIFLLVVAYLAWAIVAESRMHIDLCYAFGLVFSAYFCFQFLMDKLLQKFQTLPSKKKWTLAIAFTCVLTYLAVAFISLLYSTFYYQVSIMDTSFFYEDSYFALMLFFFFSGFKYLEVEVFPHVNKQANVSEKNVIETTPQKLKASLGNQTHFVDYTAILLAYSEAKISHIVLEKERKLLVDQSLQELEELLPESDFFRLNRQVIANRKIIQKYQPIENQKVEVSLNVSEQFSFQKVTVSKYKSAAFKKWLSEF